MNGGDIIKVTKSAMLLEKSFPPGDHILTDVPKKNCFEEVRFFGTILWRELKSYQKIALLTERKKEQARLHVRFLALALCMVW